MTSSLFKPGFEHFKIFVNGCLCDKEPWQIVTLTTTSVLAGVWLWGFIFQEESLLSRGKKTAFRLARKIPAIARRIDSELDKINETFEKEVINRNQGNPYITTLPDKGKSHTEIVELVKQYLKFGDFKWEEGYVSGAVYYFNTDLIKLLTDVYTLASYTNPLHPDIFPGVCKMEAEVVRMTANLFHGGPSSCGTMTTGGTESILMACKAYRDYARSEWGIKHPEIILPTTSHPAFDKAGLYFGIRITHTPVDPVHYKADINAMRRAISRNTILLVGSTPNFPYGTMDDIEEIAALGRQYNIPVHVDACLGGFLVIFMEQAGYKLPPFDFSVPGVTSISADTHKYGFAPKGSSVILYSEPKYRHHQFCVTTDWPGGVYGSPTVNGSRAGGKLASHFEDGRGEDSKEDVRGQDSKEDSKEDVRGEDSKEDVRGEDSKEDVRGEDSKEDGRGQDSKEDGRGEDSKEDGRGEDSKEDVRGEDSKEDGRGEDSKEDGRGEDSKEGGRGEDSKEGGRGEDSKEGGRGEDSKEGIIAACWATMVSFGLNGYVDATKKIVETTKLIDKRLREIDGLFIFGSPATSVIAIGSKVFHIYRLSDALTTRGWNLNPLQYPEGSSTPTLSSAPDLVPTGVQPNLHQVTQIPGYATWRIHLCVTYMHTTNGVADRFIADVEEEVALIMKDPSKEVDGKLAMYGMSQKIPDRSIVGDFTRFFLDSMYYTPTDQ
uniref:sphinganine-1-phosphate aldolase n=1 Tax=Timema bartmani TaxID=61472 RepID=A0A7R9I2T8_9NEOP|nr:unnamed protein product [Timema bartmani]